MSTVSISKDAIHGLNVGMFTPMDFIILISIVSIALIIFKYANSIWRPKVECSSCMKLVSTTNDIYRSRINLIKQSTLKEQMSYAELVFGTLETKLLVIYKSLIDKTLSDPLKKHEELTVYKAFLRNETQVLKDYIRLRLKENHLTQYTPDQFSIYSNEITEKLLNDTFLSMQDNWHTSLSVDIDDNINEVKLIIHDIKKDLAAILTNAYNISLQKETEEHCVIEEFHAELNKITDNVRKGVL